jgi:hypothetical protein
MATPDLELFNETGFTFDPVNWGPALVTGGPKVAQRLLYELLTPAGTVPGRPTDGSGFMDAVRTFRSEFDLFAAYALAESQAGAAVRAAESTSDPPFERYGWSRLSGAVLDGDTVTLTLTVATADGAVVPGGASFSVTP